MRVGAAVLALLVAAFAAEAQGGGGGGGRGQRGGGGRGGAGGVTMLMQNITVDAAIQTKIDSLTSAFTEASNKLRTDLGLPAGGRGRGGGDTPPVDPAKMAEFQTKNTEMTNKLRADVKALLTADQQKVFDENLANMPQGRGRGRGQ
jgi:Spy/CpxP family protein refolding chaperone